MPYLIRLLSLGFACFFLLHLVSAAIMAALTPQAVRMAGRMEPRRAARFLFAIRLFPSIVAGVFVIAFCVPSYIWLEPLDASEGVGALCLVAALLGAAIWTTSLLRGLRAITGSIRFLRDCRRPDQASAVWVAEKPAPPIALAGVIRPRFVVSRQVLDVLTPEQLELALRHERAHLVSHDNLKRLVLILAPDVVPFVNPWRILDRNWQKFTEWAADDDATGGDAERSVSLAATLVSVARMASGEAVPLVASFADHSADLLAARVDRLLDPTMQLLNTRPLFSRMVLASMALLAIAIVLLALNSSVISFVHEILERLIA